MVSTFIILTFLFASGFAYWDDLGACINKEIQEEKENNAINPTIKKLSDALIDCNNEIALQGKLLRDDDTFCEDFNKKIDYDYCFYKGMGWINENETKINYIQWGEDNQNVAEFMGFDDEKKYETIVECMCQTIAELNATGISKCGKDVHGDGRLYVSAIGRCVLKGVKAKCDTQKDDD